MRQTKEGSKKKPKKHSDIDHVIESQPEEHEEPEKPIDTYTVGYKVNKYRAMNLPCAKWMIIICHCKILFFLLIA